MTTITQHSDPRIAEILEMAAADGRPLAVLPETVCEMEDRGWLVDPFTGIATPDPDQLSLLSLRVVLPSSVTQGES